MGFLRAGLRYVAAWRGLTIVIVMAMALNFLLTPGSSLVPLLVTEHFEGAAPQIALVNAAWGVGVIAGGLLLGVWGGFRRRVVTSLTAVIGIGLAFVANGLAPSALFPLTVAAMFCLGVMNPMANGPLLALLQSTVAPEMQGRVMSLIGAGSVAMTPLSLLVAGPVADALGVQAWYVIGGVLCVAIGIGALFVPALMTIEAQAVSLGDGTEPRVDPLRLG